ncbi:related to FAD synthase [Saccharomycodes ludwigii]|uniref:FAD synthase n=1 Tax=Saccharomycodes ludwigii TaxID=36035 RepID=A0A376B8V2_9ASCO|nr:related to FAD synthase [Saccharomycodes ludwigii]
MTTAAILKHCYDITESYLKIDDRVTNNSTISIIKETQDLLISTKQIFLNEILPYWNPIKDNISISYNGGKDCQVLLIIYLACLYEYFYMAALNFNNLKLDTMNTFNNMNTTVKFALKAVYLRQENTFQIINEFIEESSKKYGLSLYKSNIGSMENSLKEYMIHEKWDCNYNTKQKAGIIIGIRRSDPYALNLKYIQQTDKNWPQFMRLQPLLDWKLRNVWSFLIYSNEPICKLYELGFTSLGGVNNTVRNLYLKKTKCNQNGDKCKDGTSTSSHLWNHFQWEFQHRFGSHNKDDHSEDMTIEDNSIDHEYLCNDTESYYPGWFLIDDEKERAGRTKRK